MATPAPVAPPPTTIMSHGPACARRRWYISDLVMRSERPVSGLSEHQLQRELDLPRRIGAADGPERRIGDVAGGRPEVRAVQQIEELRAELHGHAFAHRDLKALVHTQVPLPEVCHAECVPSHVAIRRID